MSGRFGKTMQQWESYSINNSDTSVRKSAQLKIAIPASTISTLSGEFVGAVADNPQTGIEQKIFQCEIQNNNDALKKEEESYVPIPKPGTVTRTKIDDNYQCIKDEVIAIIEEEMKPVYDTSELVHLLIVRAD